MPRRTAVLAGAAALLLAAASPLAAAAQVRLVTRPDGSKVLVGEGSATHRRTPAAPPTLRPVPRSELEELVREHAAQCGLDPRLVRAVIQAESDWDPRAVSRKGAMGLMQLMPETAAVLAVEDPFDAAENVRAGTTYLARLLDRFGELTLALAAYNAGPTTVDRHGGVPPYAETREYVRRVLSLYEGRTVRAEEIPVAAPRPRRRATGPSPRLVRDARGRLVLTNTPAAATPRSGADAAELPVAAGGG